MAESPWASARCYYYWIRCPNRLGSPIIDWTTSNIRRHITTEHHLAEKLSAFQTNAFCRVCLKWIVVTGKMCIKSDILEEKYFIAWAVIWLKRAHSLWCWKSQVSKGIRLQQALMRNFLKMHFSSSVLALEKPTNHFSLWCLQLIFHSHNQNSESEPCVHKPSKSKLYAWNFLNTIQFHDACKSGVMGSDFY